MVCILLSFMTVFHKIYIYDFIQFVESHSKSFFTNSCDIFYVYQLITLFFVAEIVKHAFFSILSYKNYKKIILLSRII